MPRRPTTRPGKLPAPFKDGPGPAGGPADVITVHCPLCEANAVVPKPARREFETTPMYLDRCRSTAITAHRAYRPNCLGDGLQITLTI